MPNKPIGVFDSGLGGLTAVRAIQKLLPGQDIVYLGDTARVPYGTRGPAVITKYAIACAKTLFQYNIQSLVIACGTVSTVALDAVRAISPVPVLGVVEPTCTAAVKATKTKRVGLIGTPATVASGAYEREIAALDASIQVFSNPCPLFVPLVENGRFNKGDAVAEIVAAEYLEPIRDLGVDTLILGCTHYPLLKDVIAAYMGDGVTLIDAGESVAFALSNDFTESLDGKTGSARYFVTDGAASFSRFAQLILQNSTNGLVEGIDIDMN